MELHQTMMRLALKEAQEALSQGEVPVGAVITDAQGNVLASAHNQRADADPLGHAELLAIRSAAQKRGDWRLQDCTLYVTLEPCPMCAGAIARSRCGLLVYGAFDPQLGCAGSVYDLCSDRRLGPGVPFVGGVLKEECSALLRQFFHEKRK